MRFSSAIQIPLAGARQVHFHGARRGRASPQALSGSRKAKAEPRSLAKLLKEFGALEGLGLPSARFATPTPLGRVKDHCSGTRSSECSKAVSVGSENGRVAHFRSQLQAWCIFTHATPWWSTETSRAPMCHLTRYSLSHVANSREESAFAFFFSFFFLCLPSGFWTWTST